MLFPEAIFLFIFLYIIFLFTIDIIFIFSSINIFRFHEQLFLNVFKISLIILLVFSHLGKYILQNQYDT